MRSSKSSSSSGVLWRDAFRIIKICVMGIFMVSVPLVVKPVFLGTYEFLSIAIPRVREILSSWLTPTFLYLILNCIIIAIVANSGVGIFNFKAATSSHEENCSPTYEQEKESQFKPKSKPNIKPIVVRESKESKPNIKPIVVRESKESKPNIKPIVVDEYNEEKMIWREEEERKSQTTSMALADSLEDTWKSITEAGRPPPARQLRKADTWETQRRNPQAPLGLESASFSRFGRSEKWDSGRNLNREFVGAEMLKSEPSLGQDELNERVEAFIAKVNRDMKLQREKSLIHYKEMVNRGSG